MLATKSSSESSVKIIGFYISVLRASRVRGCICFQQCGTQPSEWVVHQSQKEVKFDILPLNICGVTLKWHPHAATPGRRLTYPVRRRILPCWWLLWIRAFCHWWIAWSSQSVVLSLTEGNFFSGLASPAPSNHITILLKTLICMEMDILCPEIKSVFCGEVRRGTEINNFRNIMAVWRKDYVLVLWANEQHWSVVTEYELKAGVCVGKDHGFFFF